MLARFLLLASVLFHLSLSFFASGERAMFLSSTVVSPFYGLCEIFEKMTAIYGA
jgi:hypothetical protein